MAKRKWKLKGSGRDNGLTIPERILKSIFKLTIQFEGDISWAGQEQLGMAIFTLLTTLRDSHCDKETSAMLIDELKAMMKDLNVRGALDDFRDYSLSKGCFPFDKTIEELKKRV